VILLQSRRREDGRPSKNLPLQVVGGQPPRYAPPRGRRSALRRRADGNVAAVSHGQHVPTPTAAAAWRANMEVSKAAWWPDLLTLKVSRVTCDVDYFCAKFGFPTKFLGLSVLDLDPMYTTDVRQTDVRQHHRFMPPPIRGGA